MLKMEAAHRDQNSTPNQPSQNVRNRKRRRVWTRAGWPLLTVATLCTMASLVGGQQQAASPYPGVSRELAAFCAGRPSLPVELAAMVVHVKKNVSFNYKLYLLAADHVFQTGQVIPRDDFRIHAFPVKQRPLQEFWPASVPTFRLGGAALEPVPVPSSSFNLKQFLRAVPLRQHEPTAHRSPPEDADGVLLPGDWEPASELSDEENPNRHIQFDHDDQLPADWRPDAEPPDDTVVPVGAFSSFHVNLTYLVRKDFGQPEPQLVRLQVDGGQFQVGRLYLIGDPASARHADYEFLAHRLLRDPNTRITAINQIYEDWITRNFYTVVYIQRRLEPGASAELVADMLLFRGSSAALLGADQLDYSVRAAAFVTEKNGLHYYLEFLARSKFYLAAVDWSKRPFRILDARRFPIKATRAKLDNEELLLCPPAVCYSEQPVDEIVGYGRLALSRDDQLRQAAEPEPSPLVGRSDDEAALTYRHNATSRLVERRADSTSAELERMLEAIRELGGQLDTRLHLRDWVWSLRGVAAAGGLAFEWRYEAGRRNDVKPRPDPYGFALTGHEIDASFRVLNELYLVSAGQLITINYTMPNETVTSAQPIGEEFPGLSSTLLDPITGAFYDRFSSQVYFFKGDHYVGYDYASKRPLEEFLVQPAQSAGGMEMRPVVSLLGRQHQVDGVYHDLASDVVFVFSGMKFYTLRAADFKNGSLSQSTGRLAPMRCVNEHFLDGCRFDRAFPNPCQSEQPERSGKLAAVAPAHSSNHTPTSGLSFREEQQLKLRSIAARAGLLDLLLENSLLSRGARRLSEAGGAPSQEGLLLGLLVGLVAFVVLAAALMAAFLLHSWSRLRRAPQPPPQAEPPTGRLYMQNQQENHSRRHAFRASQADPVPAKSRRRSEVDSSAL